MVIATKNSIHSRDFNRMFDSFAIQIYFRFITFLSLVLFSSVERVIFNLMIAAKHLRWIFILLAYLKNK